MKKILENIANLIKVKTIVTMAVTAVFVVLSLQGKISPDNVMIIISMVVSFYFGTQHEKEGQVPQQTTTSANVEGSGISRSLKDAMMTNPQTSSNSK